MKKLIIALLCTCPFAAFAWQAADADSAAVALQEVVVNSDPQIETAKKVIFTPSKQEKKHSTNAYSLLTNMNVPDLNVSAAQKSVSTSGGGDVVILVNGVKSTPDEVATLAASEVVQIDYRRNPGGKYVGSGAVLNFITVQYDYGGNVYVSADEGFARLYGDYLAMAAYKKKAVKLTLTANGKWDESSTLERSENVSHFGSGQLWQSINPLEASTHANSQYLSCKFAHAGENHTFDASLALTRSATPRNVISENVTYAGLYDFTSEVNKTSRERGISPSLKLNYNLYLKGGQTIMADASLRHGHTNFKSRYAETGMGDIINNTVENNVIASATLSYFKAFKNGLTLGASADEYYNYYRDTYSGSCNSNQKLTNNHAMLVFHIDHNLPCGISYYLSAGITDLCSTIRGKVDNQCTPMGFYGFNYAINKRHSLGVNGHYLHSIYDPSYKNDAVIRTSFFEATMGNPNLKQFKAFQDQFTYNGSIGLFSISFTYEFLKYFGNTSNMYFAEDEVMYRQLVNDGSFHYHRLMLGVTAKLLGEKLQLKGNAFYSMNSFDSEHRPKKRNDWRGDISASYMFGDWQIKGTWAPRFGVLGSKGAVTRFPAQYCVTLHWQRGSWAAELCVENFLKRRGCTVTEGDYNVYRSVVHALSDLKGRNIAVTVTYMLHYGKKTAADRATTETSINSAILRPF